MTTQDGASTLACGEHLWFVHDAATIASTARPAACEMTRDMIGKLRRNHQHRYELPLLTAPVEMESQPVPMDPYALGLLLGDGCLTATTTPSFATADP